jgi:uncharacterized RDD family membrane protein YckC
MAVGTGKAESGPDRLEMEKIVDFAPERLRAPFFLRCAAVAIDYMVFIMLPVAWLMFSEILSDSPSGVSVAAISWYLGVILSIVNLLVLPIWKGQSVGKVVAGLTIVKMDGSRPGIRTLIFRNLLGYAITLLTFGLGFLVSAVNNSGRALHDYLGGTTVVRGRKSRLP